MSTADGTQGAIWDFAERDENFFPLNGMIKHSSGEQKQRIVNAMKVSHLVDRCDPEHGSAL